MRFDNGIQHSSVIEQREAVSGKLNISKQVVQQVVDTYIELMRQDLLSGREVRITGIVTLTPAHTVVDDVSTLAYYSKVISKSLGVPYFTVLQLLRQYLDDIRSGLLNGRSFTLRRLVGLYSGMKNGKYAVHANISESIAQDSDDEMQDFSSARSHISKYLRDCAAKLDRGLSDDGKDS